ncbi:MAG TPA: VWA domain-containing protein [Pyrinomonadaceae bacterium]|nr:VWA domain-containing protein [Pyrinomonadaceae bacterium]
MPSRNPAASARLRLTLCVAAAAALFSVATHAQTQGPTPAQTPVVRPRTVRPKSEAPRPAATPAQSNNAPAQSAPTQTNTAPSQTNAAPAQTNAAQPQASPVQASPAQPDSSQDDEAIDENDVVRVESNIVLIPASVVDFRGRAITDLKADDFELKIDGDLKPIGDVSRAETPVNIAFLFDNSASLSAAREFEKQAAVRFFQSVVRPIDRAAVYSISTTPTLSQGLTSDVNRLVRTVQNFGKPDGATALFDALTQAADYMRPLAGRKVLVLVSDGTDTVSDATFEDAINRALLAECQVYVVQTRQVEDPSLHDTVSEQRMYKISEQTGGAVFIPQSVEDLDAVFSQISLDLSQQYLLSYTPQDERKDKFFRFISLRVKTRQNLRVRARKGFYPTAAQVGTAPPQTAQVLASQPTQTRAEHVASATPARAPGANAQKRAGASRDSSASARRDSASSRKPGPEGPDMDDRPKTTAAAANDSEGQASFTLTTVGSATPPPNVLNAPTSAPTPEPTYVAPAPTATPEAAVSNSLFNASPAPASSTPVSKSEQPAGSQPSASEARPSPTPSEATKAAAPSGEPARSKTPVSAGVLNSKAVSLPKPEYPSTAKTVGAQGKVVVELTIDETGKVVKARAVSGHPLLQKAAVAAALQARFSPTLLSGEPVSVTGTISYSFLLQ